MLVMGFVSVAAGSAVIGVHTSRVEKAQRRLVSDLAQPDDLDAPLTTSAELARLSTTAPKVQAGSAILISSGVAWVIGGAVLLTVTDERRVAFNVQGLTLHF